MIPYGRHNITEEDVQEVVSVLRSDWLTQGPVVDQFEKAIADYCGAEYAVAVSSGTAALHLAALAAGFNLGDEVITSPISFVATANSILYSGATPVFADIDSLTYCIKTEEINRQLTSRTKAIFPVHFAGHPCDMDKINKIAANHRLTVVEDAAHAIGSRYTIDGETFKVGSCSHSDMTIFSFHPVKHITTGEGGVITTNSKEIYKRLKILRSHGITKETEELTRDDGPWYYEQQTLGFNYRITDFQCALGLSQLKRLDSIIEKRRVIISTYQNAFSDHPLIIPPVELPECQSAWHIYVIQLRTPGRLSFFKNLQAKGLGVQVHYIPIHLQPYYVNQYGFKRGDYPISEKYYEHCITLPVYPTMTDTEINFVTETVLNLLNNN